MSLYCLENDFPLENYDNELYNGMIMLEDSLQIELASQIYDCFNTCPVHKWYEHHENYYGHSDCWVYCGDNCNKQPYGNIDKIPVWKYCNDLNCKKCKSIKENKFNDEDYDEIYIYKYLDDDDDNFNFLIESDGNQGDFDTEDISTEYIPLDSTDDGTGHCKYCRTQLFKGRLVCLCG
jgi:hypothetical protein